MVPKSRGCRVKSSKNTPAHLLVTKVRGFEAPAAKIPPRIAPGHAARPFFSAPKRLAGSRPEARPRPRHASAGGSEARDRLLTYPARRPRPTFATGGGSPATQSPDVKDLGAVAEALFCIAPNKNLRARGQAGRCQPCGIPIEASCAARARGAEAYHQLGARSSWRPREIAVCAGCSTALHVQHCPCAVTPARAGKVSGQRDARGARVKHTATATMAWFASTTAMGA